MYFECYNVPSDDSNFRIASIYCAESKLFAIYKNEHETIMRGFETMAGKIGLITEVQSELRKLLTRGVHPMHADAIQDTIDKMELFLHPELAEAV